MRNAVAGTAQNGSPPLQLAIAKPSFHLVMLPYGAGGSGTVATLLGKR